MTVGERIENVVGKNGIRLSGTDCMVLAFTREEWFKEWNQEKFMEEAPSCPMCERPLGHDYEIIKKHEKQEPTTKNDLAVDAISRKEVLQMVDNIRVAGGFIGYNTYSEAFDQVNNMSSVPRWIPVSEGLPKAYEFVNCTCHSLIDDREVWVVETVYIPQSSDSPYSDWGNIPMLNSGDCEVVAWMHRDIPQPYKAESEVEDGNVD